MKQKDKTTEKKFKRGNEQDDIPNKERMGKNKIRKTGEELNHQKNIERRTPAHLLTHAVCTSSVEP
jgi:hypothetical protein